MWYVWIEFKWVLWRSPRVRHLHFSSNIHSILHHTNIHAKEETGRTGISVALFESFEEEDIRNQRRAHQGVFELRVRGGGPQLWESVRVGAVLWCRGMELP